MPYPRLAASSAHNAPLRKRIRRGHHETLPPTILALLVAVPPHSRTIFARSRGKTITGGLEKITDTEIVVGGVSTPLAQALDLTVRAGRKLPAAEKYIEVTLGDDSLVRCNKITFGVKETELELTTGGKLKVPTSAVLTVLRDAQDELLRKQWPALLKTKDRSDRIFVIRDGQLNSVKGAFGAIDETKQSIKFKPTGEAPGIEPAFDKLPAFSSPRPAPPEKTLCTVSTPTATGHRHASIRVRN